MADAFPVERFLQTLERHFQDVLMGLQRDRAGARVWGKDASFWGADSAHRAVIENRLGWLRSHEAMAAALPEIHALVADLRGAGFTRAVLLGMGGSSLAPEVFRLIFGVAPGFLDLLVLDNTSPESVRAVEAELELPTTAFLVSTKSGTTTETLSFQKYFAQRLAGAGVANPGAHFIAITDPGTPLAKLAAAEGFRKTFINPPDIGGRYSALSFFGLVPAALIGLDVSALIARARAMAEACGPDAPAASNPGTLLGAAIGVGAQYGFDKLTLLMSPTLAPLGAWLEQLIAESTGKQGRGVLPVDGEPWGAPSSYGPDRVFVSLGLEGEAREAEEFSDELSQAGHPVLRWTLPDKEAVAAEFFRWEMATAVVGALIEVDPFDEPNVTESKDATKQLLGAPAGSDALVDLASGGGLLIQSGPQAARRLRAAMTAHSFDPGQPASWLAAHLAMVSEGDYVALCAYLHRNEGRQARLDALRRHLGVGHPTTLGYGPRFLHSTGQFHKGGPNNGVFVQITADDGAELPIPDSVFGFRALRGAQALGDLLVLDRRERRAIRVVLTAGVEPGLTALEAALVRALDLVGPLPVAPERQLP